MTYEPNCIAMLETFEWDRTWWEHTEDTTTPRMLYIGDSISWDIRPLANKLLDGKLLLDGFHTSKALDNPFFRPTLELVKVQESHCELVLFNNGLHGFHLDDTAYESSYRNMILLLQSTFPGIPLALVLTTHVEDPAEEAVVVARNRIVRTLAAEFSLPTIDLYTLSKELEDPFRDGVHFKPNPYARLAEVMAKRITEII